MNANEQERTSTADRRGANLGSSEPRTLTSRDVGRNIGLALASNVLTPIAALVTSPLLARALGVEGRGALAAGTAPLLLAAAVGTFGVPEAVTFSVARSSNVLAVALRRGGSLLALSGFAATALAIIASGSLSGSSPVIAHLIVIGTVATIPTLLVTLLRAGAAGLQRYRLILAEQVLSTAVRLVSLVSFSMTGRLTTTSAVVLMAFTPALAGLVYLPMIRRLNTCKVEVGNPRTPSWGDLLSFGSRIWIGSLSGIVLARLDQLIMVPISGAAQLGLYAVGVSVSELALIVSNAVRDVTFSSDAAGLDEDRLYFSARLATLASAFIALALILPLRWWLPLVFGAPFSAAVSSCAVLLFAVVAGSPGSVAGAGLSARGRPGLRSAGISCGAVVNVGLLAILLPHHGAYGAAWATLGGNLTAGLFNMLALSRLTNAPVSQLWVPRWADIVQLYQMVHTSGPAGRHRGSKRASG